MFWLNNSPRHSNSAAVDDDTSVSTGDLYPCGHTRPCQLLTDAFGVSVGEHCTECNYDRVQKLMMDASRIQRKRDGAQKRIERHVMNITTATNDHGRRYFQELLNDAQTQFRRMSDCYPRAVKKALAATHVPAEKEHALNVKLACFEFAYSLSRDTPTLLRCLRHWCRFQPVQGRSSVEQHTFVLCVFATCEANMTVSTKRGVTLFSKCSPVADVLFGEDAEFDKKRDVVTPSSVLDYSARKYEGVRPGTDTFNIPYSYLNQETIAHLGEVICMKSVDSFQNVSQLPFESQLVNDTSRDLTWSDFLYNTYLSSALGPLRKRLIRLYCAHMIVNTANRQNACTLAQVVNNILDAMERTFSYIFVIARAHKVQLDREVVDTIRRGRRIATSARARCALIEAVRRSACALACDSCTQRYMDARFEDVVRTMFDSEFI